MKNSQTIKQRLLSLKGKQISQDHFLYHAYQEEKNKSKVLTFYKENKFSELESYLASDEPLESILKNLFAWYSSKTPLLSSSEPFDYLSLNQVMESFISLKLDLDKVLVEYPLKAKKQNPEELAEELAEELTKEIKAEDELELESETESSEDKEPATQKVAKIFNWDLLRKCLSENFPQLYSYMFAYFEWSYTEPQVLHTTDFDSVPPCGRYLYQIKREYPYSDLVYKPRTDKPFPTDNFSRKPFEEDPQKKALDDVFFAINKLKKNKNLKSIKLKPQNSFLRRLQHKKVYNTKGFSSKSAGEKSNRSLEIFRD